MNQAEQKSKSGLKIILLLGALAIVGGGIWAVPYVLNSSLFTDKEAQAVAYQRKGDAHAEEGKWREAIIEWRNTLQLNPATKGINYKIAKAYMTLGDVTKAHDWLVRAVNQNPGLIDAQQDLANLYYKAGEYERAYNKADIIIGLEADRPAPYLLQSKVAALGEDYEGALENVNKALELRPDYLDAEVHFGRIHYLLDDIEGAEEILKGVVAKYDTAFGSYMALSNFYQVTGRLDEAEQVLGDLADKFVDNQKVFVAMGDFYRHSGRLDDARQAYRKVVEIAPTQANSHFVMGQFSASQNEVDEAIGYYAKAVELDPSMHIAAKHLVYLLLAREEVEQATQINETVLAANRDDPDGLYFKGRLLLMQREDKEASKVLERLIAWIPNYSFAPYPQDLGYLLGLSYYRQARFQDAREVLLQAISANPRLYLANLLLAELSIRLKHNDEAVRAAEQVLAVDPENVKASLYLGQALMASQDEKQVHKGFQQTVLGLQKVVESEPENLQAALMLGHALLGEGSPDEAEVVYKEAVAKHDTALAAHLALGRFYQMLGRWDEAEGVLTGAIEQFTESAAPRMVLGSHYHITGRSDEAEQAYLNAVKLKPEESAPYLATGNFYSYTNRPDEATRYYEQARELAGEDLNVSKRMAYHLMKEGQFERADSLLNVLEKKWSGNLDVLYLGALSHIAGEEWDKAEGKLKEIVSVKPKYVFDRSGGDLPASYYLALVYLNKGDLVPAKQRLTDLAQTFQGRPQVRALTAKVDLNMGSGHSAIELAEQILEKKSEDPSAMLLLGQGLALERQWDEAAKVLNKLADSDPENTEAHLNLGLVYAASGRLDDALASFYQVIEGNPGHITALTSIRNILAERQETSQALQLLVEQSLQLPDNADLLYLLGSTQAMERDFAAAEATLNRAVELVPEMPEAHFLLGTFSEYLGDREGAAASYEETLRFQPNHAGAANNLAWLYAESGQQLDRAWRLAEKARTLVPDDPNIMDTLAWVYFKSGSYAKAIGLLNETIELDPENPILFYHLGMAQYKDGDVLGAQESLLKSLDMQADHLYADAVREMLKTLEVEEGG